MPSIRRFVDKHKHIKAFKEEDKVIVFLCKKRGRMLQHQEYEAYLIPRKMNDR